MTNIDLLCAMTGPILAGWLLEVFSKATSDENTCSIRAGFFVIGMLNVISFVPELFLLQRVYQFCPALQYRQHQKKEEAKNERTEQVTTTDETGALVKQCDNLWLILWSHPSGLPLLSLSLAFLYLTALSPNGVVLTAYLVSIGLSPTCVGFFRSIGSLSGVVGIAIFSVFRKFGGEVDNSESGRAECSVRYIDHLRKISMSFLLLEVLSVLIASVSAACRGRLLYS
jgi:MFS family permease